MNTEEVVEMTDDIRKQIGLSKVKADDMDKIGQSGAANLLRMNIDTIESQQARIESLEMAIVWALGYTTFEQRPDGAGAYWWRTELRKRIDITHERCMNIAACDQADECDLHDFVSRGDGTAKCADCGELVDISETGATRKPPASTDSKALTESDGSVTDEKGQATDD